MLTTSFYLLRKHGACQARYRHLAAALGGVKKYGDKARIPLARILEANGLDDTLWALCALPRGRRAEAMILVTRWACDCAERVLPLYEQQYPDDKRPRRRLEMTRRFLAGAATRKGAEAARPAALKAATDAGTEIAKRAAWAILRSTDCADEPLVIWAAFDAGHAADNACYAKPEADRPTERAWQIERLRQYLAGEIE
jgi:hypothetical protein